MEPVGGISNFSLKKLSNDVALISAPIRPHKKAVKKIEVQGAKEKQMLQKLGFSVSL
jgi:hypothetical protein